MSHDQIAAADDHAVAVQVHLVDGLRQQPAQLAL